MAERSDTISRGQLEALRSAIRAAAEANPSRYQDKGQRCAEFTRTVCSGFGYVRRLAELPASCFSGAMQMVSELAKPIRQAGAAEASLKAAGERLDAALASLLQARRDVDAYRRDAVAVLQAPIRDALGLAGRGNEALGMMLEGQLLDIEAGLFHAHEVLHGLAVRLPHVGRVLDARSADAFAAGAD